MRIIGNIDHPVLKITVFKMDNRISVKFETGFYEQTYKFRSGEGLESLEDVQHWVDDALISEIQDTFQKMHRIRTGGLSRILRQEEDRFEEII